MSPPSSFFTDSNRESASSSVLRWTPHVFSLVKTKESLCSVGTADSPEQWNREQRASLFQADRKKPWGHLETPSGLFCYVLGNCLICEGLTLATIKEKDQVCQSLLLHHTQTRILSQYCFCKGVEMPRTQHPQEHKILKWWNFGIFPFSGNSSSYYKSDLAKESSTVHCTLWSVCW